jgi:hypothetical protein
LGSSNPVRGMFLQLNKSFSTWKSSNKISTICRNRPKMDSNHELPAPVVMKILWKYI